MTKAVLGIIGGSGLYDLPGLENVREKRIESPWGEPSAALRIGEIAGLPIAFMSRHDKGHRLSPTDINYRANIDVMKRAGVTDLISLSACGSFKEESAAWHVRAGGPVRRPHLRPRQLVLRQGLRGACVHGASGRPDFACILPKPRRPKISRWRGAAPMCASRGRNSPRSPRA